MGQLLAERPEMVRADAQEVHFGYDFSDARFKELNDRYRLDEIAGSGDIITRATNLMAWLCAGIRHNGSYNHSEANALAILEYAYKKDKGVNCRCLAITLTDILLSQGIYARTLYLMPKTPDGDNHVGTIFYSQEDNKWIFFDPSYNAYFTNEHGELQSAEEIRKLLSTPDRLHINKTAEYRGEKMDDDSITGYKEYLTKDFYYFSCRVEQGFGVTAGDIYNLCPEGLDLRERDIADAKYRAGFWGRLFRRNQIKEYEKVLAQTEYTYATPTSYWASPD